ncbi:MAG: sodium:proton antiporter [Lachnospiraceae bacterium]|nr:sodium:proton antiporter [Lachnospiraceae bacterium]
MIFVLILIPFIAGLLGYFISQTRKETSESKKSGDDHYAFFSAIVVVLELLLLVLYFSLNPLKGDNMQTIPGFAHFGLSFVSDGFRRIYAFICIFMFAVSTLFSLEYLKNEHHRARYYLFTLITLSATAGVFFSADLYTLFIFFEIMSLASYVWVAAEENREALRAASTYMAVAVIGSLVMLMGLFMLYSMLGTLEIDSLRSAYIEKAAVSDGVFVRNVHIAGICLLFGFFAKAGAFPLHIWLPKAHPVAPAPASALLSGMLTKAGVFGVLITVCRLFHGEGAETFYRISGKIYGDGPFGEFILAAGLITMFTGALTAVFSVNIKKILACSSVSQIGFILVGTGLYGMLGEHGDCAINGAFMHMINHSFLKLVLFLCAGAVFMNLHKLDLNDIRGFGRNKTVIKLCFIAGALSIASVPLFSGYISKTLIHEALVSCIELVKSNEIPTPYFFGPGKLKAAEILFLFSGGLTFAYMTKICICVFFEKNRDERIQAEYDSMKDKYMTGLSKAVLLVPAVIFPVFGMIPSLTFDKLVLLGSGFLGSEAEKVSYYSPENLKGSLISIVIGLFVYFFIVRRFLMWKDDPSEETDGIEDGKAAERTEDGSIRTLSGGSVGILGVSANGENRVYVDIWPKWIDLEDMIYRPLLLKILPAVFGFICRILDSLTDAFVVLVRKTLLRDLKLPHELPEGTRYTNFLGRLADLFVDIMNKTLWRKNPRKNKDHAHAFALTREALFENEFIILRSMSFGLSLFCLGLMITVLYILITANII